MEPNRLLPPLHLDVETRSELDLRKTGAYVYFDHHSTDLWCAAYCFADESENVQLWMPGEPCPERIRKHIEGNGQIFAWNAAFERQCWEKKLAPKYDWPEARLEQFLCTMSEAYAMNLPGQLDQAAPALGLDVVKDKAGHRLMLQMCRPRKKDAYGRAITWWDEPEKIKALAEYCKQDVRVEMAISKLVLRLRPEEEKIYWLDSKINDRGVYIDANTCHHAKYIVEKATAELDKEMQQVSNGEIASTSAVAQITGFLRTHLQPLFDMGVIESEIPLTSVARDAITDLLKLPLPLHVERVLELRKEAAKTSTAKIDAMLTRRSSDGRMRGNLQYHGAGTGRWAARGAQLQNLPRPEIITHKDDDAAVRMQHEAINHIRMGSPVLLKMLYGKPLTVVADCIRGLIKAENGNDLMAFDFSNIEGRVNAWQAGETDKIAAFEAFDRGDGPDLYLVAAAGVYGIPVDEAYQHRQVGKVCELALGFQGGPGAFANMAKNYGLKIGELYDGIYERASESMRENAEAAWRSRGSRSGMEEKAWIAAELIKMGWRAKNPNIQQFWHATEAAAYEAVRNPGKIIQCNPVAYRMAGSFLWCRLPSGRALCYPYPHWQQLVEVDHGNDVTEYVTASQARELRKPLTGRKRESLCYKGVDQWTRKWKAKSFYGGLAVENITQAIARDVMAEAMLRVEAAGYPVILTVHDEIVTEVPKSYGSVEEFNQLMSELPKWAKGLPIAAAGWRGERYRK